MISDQLHEAIIGLLGFALTEEEMLLASHPEGTGSASVWAAAPLVAHNADFKDQQVQRVRAMLTGVTPPAFTEVDHRSPQVYAALAARSAAEAAAAARAATTALIDGLAEVRDPDLLEPARNQWLNGRQFWLQLIVRGFWHPIGHVSEYYLSHGQQERAVALQSHALATARYLRAPGPATGMAAYGLACAQARAGEPDVAASTLAEALSLNPDLHVNAARDPDLAGVRGSVHVQTAGAQRGRGIRQNGWPAGSA